MGYIPDRRGQDRLSCAESRVRQFYMLSPLLFSFSKKNISMPMQRGMNFSIKWKRQAGELMGGKKDRERFSIKFNENDPAHDAVIRLLEKQGPRSKAQFLVNAVLHYINCPETPDIAIPQTVDRAAIEEIVAEILAGKEDIRQNSSMSDTGREHMAERRTVRPKKEMGREEPREEIDQATFALIADTMSAFRSS